MCDAYRNEDESCNNATAAVPLVAKEGSSFFWNGLQKKLLPSHDNNKNKHHFDIQELFNNYLH